MSIHSHLNLQTTCKQPVGVPEGEINCISTIACHMSGPTPRKHNRGWCSVFWFQESIWPICPWCPTLRNSTWIIMFLFGSTTTLQTDTKE